MRLKFLAFLVLLAVLVTVGELAVRDPGYLLLSYGAYVVETSLIVAAILAVMVGALILLLLVGIAKLFGVKSNVQNWLVVRGVRAARQKTTLGLIELAEGHWSKARRMLEEAAADNDHPLINYLNAARAADEMGDTTGRDEYLKRAHETKTGSPDFAVGLTQAQLQYQRQDWERCLATLLRLHEKAPKHAYVMKMLINVYQQTHEWERLSQLVPTVRKSKEKLFKLEELDTLEQRCYEQWLKSVLKRKLAEGEQFEQLARVWQKVPSRLRHDAHLIYTYCESCAALGEMARAVEQIEAALARQWNDELVQLYGRLDAPQPEQAIAKVKAWLESRPNNDSALLALGRLSMRNGEWASAQESFERCLAVKQSAQVYGELGRLLADQGQHEASNDYFQKGLAMLVDGLPNLPLPSSRASAAVEGA